MSLEIRNEQLYFNGKIGKEAIEEVKRLAPELLTQAEYLHAIITLK